MRTIYTFLFSLLIFFNLPATAQESPFTGGMHHSKIYKTNKTHQTTADDKTSEKNKKNRVWNKYKSLATGEDEQIEPTNTEETTTSSAKEIEAIKTVPPQTQELPTQSKPSAMGMLLQKYQQNKEQRKDLKSLSFSKPEVLNTKSKDISGTEE